MSTRCAMGRGLRTRQIALSVRSMVSISAIAVKPSATRPAAPSRLGAAGLVALGFTAMALMLTIDRTLNAIWRVRKPRPIAQRVLIYWAAVTLGPLILGASLTLSSYAISASSGMIEAMPGRV